MGDEEDPLIYTSSSLEPINIINILYQTFAFAVFRFKFTIFTSKC